MEEVKLKTLAAELAKDLKTEADLNRLTQQLLKFTVETALNAELTEHLGYEKIANEGAQKMHVIAISKRLKTNAGKIELQTPRDRESSFDPVLVKKIRAV